jgi:hypothetical protein
MATIEISDKCMEDITNIIEKENRFLFLIEKIDEMEWTPDKLVEKLVIDYIENVKDLIEDLNDEGGE